jgi:hypothetical protein
MFISPNAAGALLAVTVASHVQAHERWADGGSVPPWVKAQCCGAADAHHLTPAQVHVTPTGYKVDGYDTIIPEARLLPSPDGEWWVFYRDKVNGNQGPVYCFFGPTQGS